jgi:hypothetical protein
MPLRKARIMSKNLIDLRAKDATSHPYQSECDLLLAQAEKSREALIHAFTLVGELSLIIPTWERRKLSKLDALCDDLSEVNWYFVMMFEFMIKEVRQIKNRN